MRLLGQIFCVIVFALLANPPAYAQIALPCHLPEYHLNIELNTNDNTAKVHSRIMWMNPTSKATRELVLNFYPQYRVPEGDHLLLEKTLELLRVDPSSGIDVCGKHGEIVKISKRNEKLQYSVRHDNLTAISIDLGEAINPGDTVTIDVETIYRLPNKQGRWGHWQGITTFANAIPVVAFFDESGWHAMPFVPWHQPFWNEAGIYHATVRVPNGQNLACSAVRKKETADGDGFKKVEFEPFIGRDFALLSSALYKEYSRKITQPDGRPLEIKVMAYAQHEHYANEMLTIIADCIPAYTEWFGPFPYEQFTIAESYFGWNGNECGGLVMIDERIFGMPQLARGYVEYLVAHETLHQWWYNLVGTNGFAETFVDEGIATHFTHKLMDRKYGRNNAMLNWPDKVSWLPNINRDNYRHSSMIGAIRRGEMQTAAGELPGFNHLVGLFTAAYDRGSKVFGMIEQRLGEAAFLDFMKQLARKYSWQVLSAATLRTELEEYTGRPWGEFFEKWVYSKGMSDWQFVSADVQPKKENSVPIKANTWQPGFLSANMLRRSDEAKRLNIVVKQAGEINEPASLGVSMKDGDGYPIRIMLIPGQQTIGEQIVQIEAIDKQTLQVSLELPAEPAQIKIDPDNVVLDSNWGNNSWKVAPRVSMVPLYTMLNETDLTNDYDRWNLAVGPWIGGATYPDPWYTRSTMAGIRAGAYRTQFFSGGLYAAVRSDYRDAVVGVDGMLDHEPLNRTQIGWNWERRISGPWWNNDGEDSARRASIYARYVFQYGSSLYLPPIHYAETYTTYQDNFLPVARSTNPQADRPGHTWMNGLHYRLNLLTPYWDPESGVWVDAVYGLGLASLPRNNQLKENVVAHQLRAEVAFVKALPSCIPFFGSSRIAGRAAMMAAFPNRGQFFALGGGTLFRGFDLAERQGSFLWVANAEWRLPMLRNIEWDVLDHTAGIRSIWLAGFYDVGAVYVRNDRVGNVAHALGLGLRVEGSVFSFMERATVRVDVARTINANSPVQVWFGLQHPF